MKKRILALALSFAMIFSVVPTDTITAKAEELNTISQETTEEYLDESATTSTDSDEAASVSDTQSDIDTLDETITDEITDETVSVSDEVSEDATSETLANGSAVDATIEETAEETNNATESTKTVRVYYSSNAVSLVARYRYIFDSNSSNREYTESTASPSSGTDSTKGTYADYTFKSGCTLSVGATALDNCTISGAKFVDGNKTTTLSADSESGSVFKLTPTNTDSTLTIYTVENNNTALYCGSDLLTSQNGSYSLSLDTAYKAQITHGAAQTATIKTATASVKNDTKNIFSSIATLASDKKSVAINVAGTSAYAGKTIVLTLTDSNNKTFNLTLNTASPVTSLTLAGVKAGNTIKTTVGTKKSFKVSINKGAELSALSLSYSSDTASSNASVAFEDGVLTINASATAETGTITFSSGSKEIAQYPLKIEDNFSTGFKPSISVVSTSDTGAKLKLSLPSNYKYANLSSNVTAYYVLSSGNYEAYMKDKTSLGQPVYVKITGDSQYYDINLLGSDVKAGKGYAANFYVSAKIGLQLSASTSEDQIESCDNYSAITGLKVSTKAPYYETKLSLTPVQTTLNPSDENVVVARAKFSKATTYNTLSAVEITSGGGSITASLSEDKTEIIVSASDFANGRTFTITAYATEPSGTKPVTASIVVNVRNIYLYASINVPSTSIYKAPSKASTIKSSLTFSNRRSGLPVTKPAKISYQIYSSSKQINNKVTISSKGLVTIPKDYIVGQDSSDSFYIRATITQKGGTILSCTSNWITIKSTGLDLSYISINGQKAGTVYANQINNQQINVYDSEGILIDPSDYTLSCKSGVISDNKYLGITSKIKECKITATANDGSGNKLTETYTIKKSTGSLSFTLIKDDEGTIDQSTKTITVYYDLIRLNTLIDDMNVCSGDSIKVTCASGFIYSYDCYSSYKKYIVLDRYCTNKCGYIPRTAEDTITITNTALKDDDPNKTTVYQVKNTSFGGQDSSITVDSSETLIYYDKTTGRYCAQNECTISGLDNTATYEYAIGIDQYYYCQVKNYMGYTYMPYASEISSDEFITLSDDTFSSTLYSSYSEFPCKFNKEYKYYLYLKETKNGTTTTLKAIPVTCKVKVLPTAPTASVTTSVTLSADKGSQTTSLTKSVKNGTISYSYNLLNANTDGTPNKFNQYFSISSAGVITAKKDLSSVASKDLTGYVEYYLKDQMGNTTSKIVKITIKVNKTKTK